MKHRVSAAAANSFWEAAFKFIPTVLEEKKEKKVPQFIQQRRKLYADYCPPVHMEYCYRKKLDSSIIKFHGSSAPLKAYQNNKQYEKLYEMAHVKVINLD